MNYKDTYTGGEPDINIDDLLRDVISTRDALMFVAKGVNNGFPCVLGGCTQPAYVPGAIAITEGYIYIDNKIVRVEAQTVADTLGSNTWKYVVSTDYDAGGDKLFADNIFRRTWRKERGIVTNVAAGTLGATDLDVVNPIRLRPANIGSLIDFSGSNKNTFLKVNNSGIQTYSDVLNDSGNKSSYDHHWGAGGDMNDDGTWRELDLTANVAQGAKWVLLRVYVNASFAGSYTLFREHGNTDTTYNVTGISSPSAEIYRQDCWVKLSTDYKIDYRINSGDGGITIGGYI